MAGPKNDDASLLVIAIVIWAALLVLAAIEIFGAFAPPAGPAPGVTGNDTAL